MFASALAAFMAASGVALGQTITGQYDCLPAGSYTLCQNLWGESAGTGSQSSTLISASGDAVSWSTNWTWANGPNNVKSYANLQASISGVQLSAVTTAPTAWEWDYISQSSGLRADVSYDIWFGEAPTGTPASSASAYEIMIWLSGEGGIQPIGSQIATPTVGGITWNLWSGPNSNWKVFSFVSSAGNINDFNFDLNDIFQYLTTSQGVSSSLYIQAIQTGTEAFEGSADLEISSFSVAVNS